MDSVKYLHIILIILILLTGCGTEVKMVTTEMLLNEYKSAESLNNIFEPKGNRFQYGYSSGHKMLTFIDFLPLWLNDSTNNFNPKVNLNYPQLQDHIDNTNTPYNFMLHGCMCSESAFQSRAQFIAVAKSGKAGNGYITMNSYVSKYLFDKYLFPDSIIFYVNGEYVRGKEIDKLIEMKKRDLKGFSLDYDSVSKTLNIFVQTRK